MNTDARTRRFDGEVGAAVRRLRLEHRKSVPIVATRMGFSKMTLRRIEMGERSMTLREALCCAAVFHVPLARLLEGALVGEKQGPGTRDVGTRDVGTGGCDDDA